jgi:hypothetical protein
MTHTNGDAQSDVGLDRRIAELVAEVGQRIEWARHKANAAQQSAAASMRKSAESQDRIAKMYEERAEHGLLHDDVVEHDDDLDHAARHRQFAKDDRRMAERLQQNAGQQHR